jgi:hypothetical protein
MHVLGVSKEGIALLRKEKNRIELEWARADVKPLDIEVVSVTGLEASQVVCRELSLKLKKEKEILAILPFQVENLIPFPIQEIILQPQIFPTGEVILLATQKSFLRDHLKEMAELGIDPDQVSCVPQALHQWGMWRFPDQKNLCILSYDCCIVSQNGKLIVSQSFQDRERMLAFVKTKYPEIRIIEAEEFAIPIGLALDGFSEGVQFRQEEFASRHYKNRIRKWQWGYVAAALVLAAVTLGIGSYKIAKKESGLHQKLSVCGAPEGESLKLRLQAWENSLASLPSLVPAAPLVTDLLAWISTQKEEIDIVHLHYTPTSAKVDLEFKAPSPTVARAFHELLSRGDSFIDSKKEITWNVTQDRYKTSFYLK